MRDDWKYLVDELKITAHPDYLHHNGKPVLSIWGPGLKEDRHVPHDPAGGAGTDRVVPVQGAGRVSRDVHGRYALALADADE